MALPMMARALTASGIQVAVATTDDDGPGSRLSNQLHGVPVEQEGFRVFYFPKQTEFYKVSLPLLFWLLRNVVNYDVVHVHAVFSFSTLAAGWACRLRSVPYIVRPLGVLNTWGMENRRSWLKALSFRLLDKPLLDRAAALHYTSGAEAREAARHGLCARAVVIPLGIDLAPFQLPPHPERFLERFPPARGRQIVLFLSRIDPKKGIEVLLEALASLESKAFDPLLVIAGGGDAAYVAKLKARVVALGLEQDVIWAGFLDGADKLAAFAAVDLFVLPSYSENFGIALLEAMAAGLPCISSDQVALAMESGNGAALCITACDPEAISRVMARLLGDAAERRKLAERAREVVAQRYSLEAMGKSLTMLYRELTPV